MSERLGASLSSQVFVDASGWVAAWNRRDQYYDVARSLLDACLDREIELVTTNWTAYEALSLLQSRTGADRAAELWGILTDKEAVTLLDVTPEIERRALGLFCGYRDKTWSGVDCASLVVMEELGCRQVIAFDRHFVEASRQRGLEVLP